jgi:hypothetical protein
MIVQRNEKKPLLNRPELILRFINTCNEFSIENNLQSIKGHVTLFAVCLHGRHLLKAADFNINNSKRVI